MVRTKMKQWGAVLLAVILLLGCMPALPASAAITGISPGGAVLQNTATAYPTARSYYVAGDTYYTWNLNTAGFAGTPAQTDFNAGFGASLTPVFSNTAMSGLFDLVYTPYDGTNPATVSLKFKSSVAATTALSGTFKLRHGSDSAAVNLYGKVFASTLGTTATRNQINGIETGVALDRYPQLNGRDLTAGQSLNNLDIRPGATVTLRLDSSFFNWTGGKPAPRINVTKSQLSTGKITVRSTKRVGSNLIKSLDFETKAGVTYIKLEFVEELVGTSDKDFEYTITLHHNGVKRLETVIAGTLSNPVETLGSGQDYVDLSGGAIASTNYNHTSIDVYTGNDLTLHTRMFKGKKYYAKSNTDLSSSDENILLRYPQIIGVYNVSQSGLAESSTKASFDLGSTYYVYDKNLSYLGTTKEKVAFSSKYFVADRKLSSSDVGSSSGSSGSSGGSSSGTVTPPTSSGSTPSTLDVSVDSAKTATSSAKSSGSTTVRFKNAANISLDALKAIANGGGKTVWGDSMTANGSGVNVRISFNPAGRTAGMNLSAYTYSEGAAGTKALFQKWYQGNFAVISFGQKGSFSQQVRVSAKVDLTGIDSSKLKFYSYDKATNSYKTFTPTYSVDGNGYLVFDTILAGDIVIGDRALTRR